MYAPYYGLRKSSGNFAMFTAIRREKVRSCDHCLLIEATVREYLKSLTLSLERLCDAIDREEAEKRRGEDWSIASDYVRSRLRRLA
jgi:Zn-finger protein